jgi:cytochrome b pre-mRNA-processing protein 3
MGLLSLFRRPDPLADAAEALYGAIVAQARSAPFFADLGVPDSVDGRFDMIVLHTMLVMRRLRTEPAGRGDLAQALFDHLFRDMDRSLREIGIGDMSVGKHIKKMAKAFYGRAADYETGLDTGPTALADALARNLYRNTAPNTAQMTAMAAYVQAADVALRAVPSEDLVRGRIAWPSAPQANAA